MRILIVDDERPARDRLRRLLAGQEGIGAVDEARDGVEALAKVEAFRPDALLLDIQMPGLSGLDVAASLPASPTAPAPLVVFVTAHDDYALRAFDANAIDYLLKPCDPVRLARALARLKERLAARPAGRGAAPAPAGGHADGLAPRQLLVAERGVTRIVRIADLRWLETADNYVALHDGAGVPLLRQTLAGLLETLGPAFVRCHRRAAVHLPWIDRIVANDKGDGHVVLADGGTVPLSRQYRPALLAALLAASAAPPAVG
ncbi:LytR/AlgR family response regulator transcription factor [Pseudoduganella umbonata]|uniref:Response regulator n=1 Tax=Pseudoduganella umbonata TaxID=864828 RepID=A0A4P8HNP8_9BURK|nr:response regulator [Pseudoduganella umbonata]MBB3221543.1 two-component system LytT family response regulator [Pseudoduganella umbonata]QCP10686.1 response regulator [Pseudoduganella umbonata]